MHPANLAPPGILLAPEHHVCFFSFISPSFLLFVSPIPKQVTYDSEEQEVQGESGSKQGAQASSKIHDSEVGEAWL